MQIFLQFVGTGLVLVSLADIFLTVLHPRSESNLLSMLVARIVWGLFRAVAQGLPKQRDRILSYGGATIIVTLTGAWILMLLIGFALIVWPGLGTAIQMTPGETPTDFVTALYYSGFSLTTLGTGDLIPTTATYRFLMVLKSFLGFSIFTLVLSYVLAVYGALNSRNTFALSLHHRTADSADPAELLRRLATGNDLSTLNQNITDIAEKLISLVELNNSYPLLLYFRYRQPYYALARIIYLVIDAATLTKSALDQDYYSPIINSSGIAEIWHGGQHLLDGLNNAIPVRDKLSSQAPSESFWREHYYHAL
ncbi:two pore domain potassium channel family protein [Nodosilinea sp. LEGE 07298]|uniref:potassium channel family protein n=1 Tax=Nodosilinea sp. LEGE 07298 TaxID=2777970 RepID=UPI00187E93B4|nr:potassium channel family protein [Nodosilinea sp. LEGE 07298]MBE9109753.1 two pore domain potassium channel family protein [Nodosilinea sp. LEGE 07298]